MNSIFNKVSRRKIKVTILATYPLVRQSLQLLLEGDRTIHVLDAVGSIDELLEKVSRRQPDVVLLCLLKNEEANIAVFDDLRQIIPQAKSVLLSSPNISFDQTAALKLGVAGIVSSNQSVRVLIRAIQQVSDGEVWLNQKLLVQLLDKNFNASANGKSKKGFLHSDELTNRELEVVTMIGLGMNNKDISKKLFISEATVRHHLSSIYGKLNVEDRLNLAIYAHQRRIVPQSAASAAL